MEKCGNKSVIRRLAAILLAAAVAFCSPLSAAAGGEEKPEEMLLYAQAAVLMDADSGRVLYGKNETEFKPMASTTKIMTCIIALENGNLDDKVEVSAYAASMPDVQLGIREGETYYLKDLLHSLMLESHNDSAVAIAEHVGGSVEGFAAMMNQKARDLGCSDTNFITPNGLDAKNEESGAVHGTTAEDLAKIMRYCILYSPVKDEFLEITRTASWTFGDVDQKRSYYCGNHNALLTMMPEALSGKTGFTGNAGYCYVGALTKDDRTFIVALLGCGWPPHKTYKWSDVRKLAEYGMENYEYRDIFEKNQSFPSLYVEEGVEETAKIGYQLPADKQTLRVLMREGEEARISCEIPSKLSAPVRAGTGVGSVKYYVGQQLVGSFPVYTLGSVDRKDFCWGLNEILQKYFLQK